jgi:hypothetical protein
MAPEGRLRVVIGHVRRHPIAVPGRLLKYYQKRALQRAGYRHPVALFTPVPNFGSSGAGGVLKEWQCLMGRMPAGTFEMNCHPGLTSGDETLYGDRALVAIARDLAIDVISFSEV